MKVVFFHKPGCINNEKQKRILKSAGLELDERNMLEEKWEADVLNKFFQGFLISECFNQSAPAIKNGEVVPENLTFEQAVSCMIDDPILIRRPLIKIHSQHILGFNTKEIEIYTGVRLEHIPRDIETCAKTPM